MYHKGNPPSEGCQDSGDPDLPVPPMRERTESIREPAVPLQGLWGLWGLGAQGAVYGGAEGADSAGLCGAGPPAGTAEAVWGLHRDGPEAASLPPVAETLRPAEEGDVLGVLWGGRTSRSGRRRTRPVGACVVSHRSEAGSLSGLWGGRYFRLPPAGPSLRGQAVGLIPSAGIPRSVRGEPVMGGKPCVSASRWLSMRR